MDLPVLLINFILFLMQNPGHHICRGGGGLNPGIVISIGAVFVLGVFLYLNSVY